MKQRLGQGAQGSVVLCINSNTQQECCVKVVKFDSVQDLNAAVSEVCKNLYIIILQSMTMAALHHTHIVPLEKVDEQFVFIRIVTGFCN